jgi:hypothetical protein
MNDDRETRRGPQFHRELGWGFFLWVLVGGAVGNLGLWVLGMIVIAVAWFVTRPPR